MIQSPTFTRELSLPVLDKIAKTDLKKFDATDNWRKEDAAKGRAWTSLSEELTTLITCCNTDSLNALAEKHGWLFMKYKTDGKEVVIRFSDDYKQAPRISTSEQGHETLSDARHIVELRECALNTVISIVEDPKKKTSTAADVYLKKFEADLDCTTKDIEALGKLSEKLTGGDHKDALKLIGDQQERAVKIRERLLAQIEKLKAASPKQISESETSSDIMVSEKEEVNKKEAESDDLDEIVNIMSTDEEVRARAVKPSICSKDSPILLSV